MVFQIKIWNLSDGFIIHSFFSHSLIQFPYLVPIRIFTRATGYLTYHAGTKEKIASTQFSLTKKFCVCSEKLPKSMFSSIDLNKWVKLPKGDQLENKKIASTCSPSGGSTDNKYGTLHVIPFSFVFEFQNLRNRSTFLTH